MTDRELEDLKKWADKKVAEEQEREKLIELLSTAGWNLFADGSARGEIADHLIANGVTLQKERYLYKESGEIVPLTNCQQWISVNDRLPPPYTPVLTCRQSFGKNPTYTKVDQMVLLYGDDKVWTDDLGTWKTVVTHWMPLPQPPKGE